ncbi:hypothetical protein GFB56_30805 [Ensifer sp. T173]|uniref:Membrane-anchored protein n=1 Tax=Ensifer canadensis TaxID=555315 RepID=A0AAW4FUN3_9HYPH|nr:MULTISPECIES: hypothetical protein [Ensifer]MDP9634110.1 hypothetical protein [Ensifer adhaerens]KQU87191.1 hypothetical protein ASD00_30680 [Ensifer sp. Root31]KQW66573.1 hypothetical protein ASD03_34485 [Ensifer sp. Root127]MBM3095121.1 hypothetical protein [Ensifer canadensis]NOV19708.1 hypothetical protein [Ensifer canadensis]
MAQVAEKLDTPPPENEGAKPINGRVDAIDGGRLFGWAHDPAAPGQRLKVRVLLDGAPVAEAIADRNRPDLKRNGIGDGQHAFEIALPEAVQKRSRDLVVMAFTGDGAGQPLRVPQPDEQAAEALIAAPLTRVLDKLDVLMAAQRQLQISQRSLQRVPHIGADAAETDGAADPSAGIDGLRAEMSRRLDDLDVHLLRMDGVVAGMEKTLSTLQKRAGGETRPLVLLLFVLMGFAAGALLALLAR